jgi:hypothetical protein
MTNDLYWRLGDEARSPFCGHLVEPVNWNDPTMSRCPDCQGDALTRDLSLFPALPEKTESQ